MRDERECREWANPYNQDRTVWSANDRIGSQIRYSLWPECERLRAENDRLRALLCDREERP